MGERKFQRLTYVVGVCVCKLLSKGEYTGCEAMNEMKAPHENVTRSNGDNFISKPLYWHIQLILSRITHCILLQNDCLFCSLYVFLTSFQSKFIESLLAFISHLFLYTSILICLWVCYIDYYETVDEKASSKGEIWIYISWDGMKWNVYKCMYIQM